MLCGLAKERTGTSRKGDEGGRGHLQLTADNGQGHSSRRTGSKLHFAALMEQSDNGPARKRRRGPEGAANTGACAATERRATSSRQDGHRGLLYGDVDEHNNEASVAKLRICSQRLLMLTGAGAEGENGASGLLAYAAVLPEAGALATQAGAADRGACASVETLATLYKATQIYSSIVSEKGAAALPGELCEARFLKGLRLPPSDTGAVRQYTEMGLWRRISWLVTAPSL